MNILLIDDAEPALQELEDAVSAVLPTAQRLKATTSREAQTFSKTTPIDIAFVGINMRVFMERIFLVTELTYCCPDCKVIFCITNKERIKDIPRIKRSPYLIKPITSEQVQSIVSRLRHPMLD